MMRRLSRHMRFQSTPSAWRETDRTVAGTGKAVFQSTPSAWRETILARIPGWERCISIHSLRMEGDKRGIGCGLEAVHFNPLPPHGGRLCMSPCFSPFGHISIHSLRMEGDCPRLECVVVIYRISIHSLRMEGDPRIPRIFRIIRHFNPLPPHGGRHPCRNTGCAGFHHFNPLPPHGGRHINNENSKYSSSFQSTPSAWRET